MSVIGSGGQISDEVARLAGDVGRALVEAGFRLVTGGLGGVMEAAARGAAEIAGDGDVVAIVPGNDPNTAHRWASVVIPTGLGFYRNGLVAHSDAVVAIGGGAGTLSEMALAWKLDRLVVGVDHPAVTGWSKELAGRPIDARQRPFESTDDRVHRAACASEVVDLVNRYVRTDTHRTSSGLDSANVGESSSVRTVDTLAPSALLERYDAFLIDAYGVLVTSAGAIDGAAEVLRDIERAGKSWVLCTNDASKLPETSAEQYGALLGREIDPERVVTSGRLLVGWVEQGGWMGATACVLGPADSLEYARRAGLEPVGPEVADGADVFVVGDESGFDLLRGLDSVLTAMVRRIEEGRRIGLVCPNDDVIYPRGDGGFGVAAGGFAGLLEACLNARFSAESHRFDRLGKPRPALFEEGLRRLGNPDRSRVVMIGDTPATDIRGANGIGLDVVLFGNATPNPAKIEEAPTWRLLSW